MLPFLTITHAALAVIPLLITLLYLTKNRKHPRYPPGPKALPLLGNVLQLGRNPIKVFKKWGMKYGPIYSVRLGTQDTIMLSDPKLVKELFAHINSTGRPTNPVTYYFGKEKGIINTGGHLWHSQRRFTLRKLRDVGVFKSSIEEFIADDANTLIKSFEGKIGQPISGLKLFNSIWRTVSGETVDWDSPNKPEILSCVEAIVDSINRTTLSGLLFAPFLRYVAPGYFGWTEYVNSVNNFFKLTDKAVEHHKGHFDQSNPQDFIDHNLAQMQETGDLNSPFYKENGDQNLRAIVADLFLAGSETSSTTLSYAIFYLLYNKKAQRKAQQELETVVGCSQQVALADKSKLPYMEAVLLETLRLSSFFALGVPHRMIADTEFHGFFLPKGVTVISNLYVIHHDPKIWGEDANEFRPERFLNEDETRVIHHEAFMPFSTGRRQCLGESLAMDTIFLFLTNILQKFNIEHDPNQPVLSIETNVPGLIVDPKPFNFVLESRIL